MHHSAQRMPQQNLEQRIATGMQERIGVQTEAGHWTLHSDTNLEEGNAGIVCERTKGLAWTRAVA